MIDFLWQWAISGKDAIRDKSLGLTSRIAGNDVWSLLAPAGTIAANGTYTSSVTLPTIVSNHGPGAWVYFPATAVASGVAGLYWVVFSTFTVGTVYRLTAGMPDTALGFDPYTPNINDLTLVAGSGTAFTQTANLAIVLASCKVPAGVLGKSGSVTVNTEYASSSTATGKSLRGDFGLQSILTQAVTTSPMYRLARTIKNIGSENRQIMFPAADNTVSNGIYAALTVDTSIDRLVTFGGSITTPATEWVAVNQSVFITPGA